jgi:hypothetical protein
MGIIMGKKPHAKNETKIHKMKPKFKKNLDVKKAANFDLKILSVNSSTSAYSCMV